MIGDLDILYQFDMIGNSENQFREFIKQASSDSVSGIRT